MYSLMSILIKDSSVRIALLPLLLPIRFYQPTSCSKENKGTDRAVRIFKTCSVSLNSFNNFLHSIFLTDYFSVQFLIHLGKFVKLILPTFVTGTPLIIETTSATFFFCYGFFFFSFTSLSHFS